MIAVIILIFFKQPNVPYSRRNEFGGGGGCRQVTGSESTLVNNLYTTERVLSLCKILNINSNITDFARVRPILATTRHRFCNWAAKTCNNAAQICKSTDKLATMRHRFCKSTAKTCNCAAQICKRVVKTCNRFVKRPTIDQFWICIDIDTDIS